MKFVDLSGNSRMARLMDLTRELRGCQSPYEALLMYSRYLRDYSPAVLTSCYPPPVCPQANIGCGGCSQTTASSTSNCATHGKV